MYNLFHQKMLVYPVFSTADIEKAFPNFDKKNLVYWQKKRYIERIRNNYYCFSNVIKDEAFLIYASNKIYNPSYVSFETALSIYNIIPEGVYTITSVSSLKTNLFTTSIGIFSYKHLKPNLFFGYRVIAHEKCFYKLAELEKTILDYLYLHHTVSSSLDFGYLRWNKMALKNLNMEVFVQYQSLFSSKALNTRVAHFLDYLYA